MSTIIKASDRGHAAQGVAFNFDDMAAKAKEYLQQVQAQASQIIAKAEHQADQVRKQAEVEGRQAGERAVEKMIQKQLAGQLETLLPALRQVVQQIQDAKQAWLTHWEKNAVHVAAAIAKRLIRRELSQTPEITLTLVREALELSAGSSRLRIHMNPTDHEALDGQVQALTNELAPLATAEVVADPQISPGGCRIETAFGVVNQQFEAQLARIEEELT